MIIAYLVECRTGCSCCSGDNHYRGPYKIKEDAERGIEYFRTSNNGFCPVSSQFSRRGSYYIKEITIEGISEDRYIINDNIVIHDFNYINVNDDGSIDDKYGSSSNEFLREIFNDMESND